nr:reverse transcriptase domain-containing protein [Tanacetum cinerariifolium]
RIYRKIAEIEHRARIAEQMGVKNLPTHMDSRLVVNKINESYIAKEPGMIQYLEKVKMLASCFKKFTIKQVPRSENKKADALSKIASTSFQEILNQAKETLLAKRKKARAVWLKSRRYDVIDRVLNKKSFLKPWLWCVRPLQGRANGSKKPSNTYGLPPSG